MKFRDAHKAWGKWLEVTLREPTDEEITKLMPVDHQIPVDKMTVGDYIDFKKNIWRAKQTSEIIGLLMKEVAYARRNEHHKLAEIFGKEAYEALPDEVKAGLKKRFSELNEEVKGNK